MDEFEFRRILQLFPVVRSRDYQAGSESSGQLTSQSVQDEELQDWQNAWDSGATKEIEIHRTDQRDAFWEKLKLAAEKKVGAAEAVRFCKAFQHVHKKLVYEELSLDAAQSFINNSKAYGN